MLIPKIVAKRKAGRPAKVKTEHRTYRLVIMLTQLEFLTVRHRLEKGMPVSCAARRVLLAALGI